jgi:hypothetical protein
MDVGRLPRNPLLTVKLLKSRKRAQSRWVLDPRLCGDTLSTVISRRMPPEHTVISFSTRRVFCQCHNQGVSMHDRLGRFEVVGQAPLPNPHLGWAKMPTLT